MNTRFDYISFDKKHEHYLKDAKLMVIQLNQLIEKILKTAPIHQNPEDYSAYVRMSEYCDRAIDKLEQSYMYIGKAIRDHQIICNGDQDDLPERNDA